MYFIEFLDVEQLLNKLLDLFCFSGNFKNYYCLSTYST